MTEDRKKIWGEYDGTKTEILRHLFLDYDRYYEADLIIEKMLTLGVDLKNLKVLDYGCGPGDYGMQFARMGARVGFYDTERACLDFACYRMIKSSLVPDLVSNFEPDLVIFGEVLEHCDDPLGTLRVFAGEWIFTSSYPYRSDDPEDDYWRKEDHKDMARLIQPEVRKFLNENYEKIKLTDNRAEINLWRRK